MPPFPPGGIVENGSAARKAVQIACKWYSTPNVQTSIVRAADEVKAWLQSNKQTTNEYGDAVSGATWISLGTLDSTEDSDRIDFRISGLRKRLHAHGLRRLLRIMIDKELLSPEACDYFDDATGFAAMALHEELMGYRLSPKLSKHWISLDDARDRYGLSEGTNPDKIRDRQMVRMATFGLWEVTGEREYQIRVGFVAETFHHQVFSPLLKEFKPKLFGKKGVMAMRTYVLWTLSIAILGTALGVVRDPNIHRVDPRGNDLIVYKVAGPGDVILSRLM